MTRTKEQSIYKAAVYCALIVLELYFLVQFLSNTVIRRTLIFAGSLLLYVISLSILVRRNKTSVLMLILPAVLLIGLGSTIPHITLTHFYVCLNFLTLFSLFEVFDFAKDRPVLSKKTITNCALIFGITLIFLSFSNVAYRFEDGRSTTALTLGMTNPNFTGMMLMGIIFILLVCYNDARGSKRLPIVAELIFLYWMLFKTEARSSLVSSLIVLVYAVFWGDKKINLFFVVLAITIPFLFPYIYLGLYKSFNNFIFLGKPFFSGRELTYRQFLSQIDAPFNVLFGNLKDIFFSNAHNGGLSIFCNTGIIGFLTTYIILISSMRSLSQMSLSRSNNVAIASILAIIFQTFGEGLMLTGYFPSTMIVFLLLYLSTLTSKSKRIAKKQKPRTISLSSYR